MSLVENSFYKEIKKLLQDARQKVYQSINSTMTLTYYKIGKRIVEEEQGGEKRAEYGKALLKNLSEQLSKEFGKGYSEQNLKNMRQFYLSYKKDRHCLANLNLAGLTIFF
ncbi:uncharacterized protein DUF1016 [Malaciobacter marinus]|uniref:Uncharacterized protein DUF1016 n=1 Tax=Malaciobacter marinus TaxID=505249 RepID=A0AB36ZX50_9BACT|nr:uncharacterized protein DUF1016 [Malaciobacter marinus]